MVRADVDYFRAVTQVCGGNTKQHSLRGLSCRLTLVSISVLIATSPYCGSRECYRAISGKSRGSTQTEGERLCSGCQRSYMQ